MKIGNNHKYTAHSSLYAGLESLIGIALAMMISAEETLIFKSIERDKNVYKDFAY